MRFYLFALLGLFSAGGLYCQICSKDDPDKKLRAVAVKTANGSYSCATDPASEIHVSVSRSRCAERCKSMAATCWNFNYHDDTRRCELYGHQPDHFGSVPGCKYYEVTLTPLPTCILNEFKELVPGSFYTIVYKTYTWDDARIACRQFHPKCHLVVINDQTEYNAIKNYVGLIDGAHRLMCKDAVWGYKGYNGYWTSGQRTDRYSCPNPSNTKNFVWRPDNHTELQYPTGGWLPWGGEPNCYSLLPAPNNLETCMNILLDSSWNDINCFYPQCPFCEISLSDL